MKIIGDTVQFEGWDALTIHPDLPATVRARLEEELQQVYEGEGEWLTYEDMAEIEERVRREAIAWEIGDDPMS